MARIGFGSRHGGFASEIWDNVRSVRLGKHGGIEAPVRASSRDGILIGKRAIVRSRRARAKQARAAAARSGETESRRWWQRVLS